MSSLEKNSTHSFVIKTIYTKLTVPIDFFANEKLCQSFKVGGALVMQSPLISQMWSGVVV